MTAPVALVAAGPSEIAEATKTALRDRGWTISGSHGGEPAGSEDDAVRAVVQEFGRLDLVVAGYTSLVLGAIDEQPVGDWWRVVDANLGRSFRFARASAPHLRESGGSIVLLGSEWGVKGLAGGTAFSASTAGLIGLMRALARELAPIRVNVVAPGETDSSELAVHAASSGRPLDEVRTTHADLSLLHRLGRPEEVANAIAFLASDDASFFTGQVLSPTGGRTRG
jgi:NAD(P)-dependent dehydrogenase (short-subunit alcohol dehydrogenase family)